MIDGSRTFEQPENKFFLRYKEGDTLYGRIECILKRGSSKDFTIPPSDILTGPDDALIAVFDKSGTQAYGWLVFEPVVKPDDTPGHILALFTLKSRYTKIKHRSSGVLVFGLLLKC